MANCCPHDWVDIVGAFGPTLATLFAGGVAISVYKRGEKFQRQLVRPLLTVRYMINPGHEETRWIVSLRNEGQGAANVEAFTVVAGERIIEPEPLENPTQYWERVLDALGVLKVRFVEAGHRLEPPVSVGAGQEQVLFDANMYGRGADVSAAIGQLEIRIHGKSGLGEPFLIRHRFGHSDS